jgi:DNA-binding transcriptional MerR regulator
MPTYLTTDEWAQMARTTVETARYWRHIGYGPASFKVGRRVLYDRDDCVAWLKSLRDEQQSAAGGDAA